MVNGTRITDDELLSWAQGGFIIKKEINHEKFLPNPGMFPVLSTESENSARLECSATE